MAEDAGSDGPGREEFSPDPLAHVDVWAGMTVGELAGEFAEAGVGAVGLARAVDVYAEMLGRADVTNFVGVAGAMVPGGMRQVLVDLIRDGHVDALVTTGANLTHDAIEAIGGNHHHGRTPPSGGTPSEHDERLREEGVDRIYNVYLPQEHFEDLERHLRAEVFPACEEGVVSIRRFVEALGRANARVHERENVPGDPGVAAAAAESGVPVFCPAIQDSVLGLQAWMHSQVSGFSLDALADMTELSDLAHEADRAGALLVGGGVPKNFVLQAMLVVPGAYDYAVQLTMDPEWTGGLSGASLDEARSWGKLEPDARNATVVGDATMTFPFLVAAAREHAEPSTSE